MKNNVINLTSRELLEINGGSEITNAIWYGIGASFGYMKRTWQIWTADPNNPRFR